MNIIILKILLSIISGIILGLYLKNIAFLVYIAIVVIYIFLINNTKRMKFNKIDIFVLMCSIAIFVATCFVDYKFDNLYNEIDECYGIGEIVSFAEEKTYTNKYIIKIKSLRKFKQI